MHFTEFTDYSLRVLLYLHMKEGGKSTVRQVAEYYNISQNHLVKVVHSLGIKGYITSEKGKGGGIRLSKPAEEINIGDVIRSMEPHFDLVECFKIEENRPCRVEPVCALKSVLGVAMDSFFNVVDKYSLADAVANNVKLK